MPLPAIIEAVLAWIGGWCVLAIAIAALWVLVTPKGTECRRDVQGGQRVFRGTRIPISAVRHFQDAGYTAKQIKREYPTLSLEQIESVRRKGPSAWRGTWERRVR